MTSSLRLLATTAALVLPAAGQDCRVYFGTFARGPEQGIYQARLDGATGQLSEVHRAATLPSPNFLALPPAGSALFAVTRTNVVSLERDGLTGRLAVRDQQPAGGDGPCHLSVDATGQALLVANYGGGSVQSFRLLPDGRLAAASFHQHQGRGPHPTRQTGPHAHCIVPAPGGRFALACDLGLDQVLIYRFDPVTAALEPHQPASTRLPPGSGPRQMAFSPDGRTAYVINELTCTLTALDWDGPAGRLTPRQTVSLLPAAAERAANFTAAALAVRPDGRFIYGSVRGQDAIAVLTVDAASGSLSLVESVPCGGKVPRGLGLDPSGRWLVVAHQESGSVGVFAVAAETGRLTPNGPVIPVPAPVDVKFVPVKSDLN